jgi:hypothetical protein
MPRGLCGSRHQVQNEWGSVCGKWTIRENGWGGLGTTQQGNRWLLVLFWKMGFLGCSQEHGIRSLYTDQIILHQSSRKMSQQPLCLCSNSVAMGCCQSPTAPESKLMDLWLILMWSDRKRGWHVVNWCWASDGNVTFHWHIGWVVLVQEGAHKNHS